MWNRYMNLILKPLANAATAVSGVDEEWDGKQWFFHMCTRQLSRMRAFSISRFPSDGSCDVPNFFGPTLNTRDGPMWEGVVWDFFGGKSNSLKELRMSVHPGFTFINTGGKW